MKIPRCVVVILSLIAGFCALKSPLAGAADTVTPALLIKTRESIEIDGRERFYVVSRPSVLNPDQRYPLIVAFHAYRGEVKVWMHEYTQFEPLMSDRPFIIVYPEAPVSWNSRSGSSDLDFFDQIVARLSENFPLDKARIYAVGHSNGAGFASALVYYRPDSVAAVAVYAGLTGVRPSNADDRKPPLYVIWGENDEIAPAASDRVQATIQAFRNRGYPVDTWVVPKWGHSWPSREHQPEEKILSFFFKHQLPEQNSPSLKP